MKRLQKDFYTIPAIDLAPQILGKLLCRKINNNVIKLRISETEAYYGENDTACHAHKGKTNRTKVMYEEGGITYIYLCYGVHYLLNIVSGEKDFPEAVLIRGVEGFNGPGKLTKKLEITKHLNYENLITSENIWLEDDNFKAEYITTERIGISYATAEYREVKWRFVATNI
ncbi:MAG: DNA-3-methyladenine glycosylase [Bacteroidetes bacterium]|nr:DNA-3-methyladenine glycosylase [Bacteroidota bacterium]